MKLNVICYALLGVALLASLFSLHPVWMWLLLANLLTFLIYGGDKLAARKGWRRVPEATLLLFGALGGWLGALAAQQLFRHKTRSSRLKPGSSSAWRSTWWRCWGCGTGLMAAGSSDYNSSGRVALAVACIA